MQTAHVKINHECSLCGTLASISKEVDVHVESVHDNFEDECNVCGHKIGRTLCWRHHSKKFHEEVLRLDCKPCGNEFCTRPLFKKPSHRKHSRLKSVNAFFVIIELWMAILLQVIKAIFSRAPYIPKANSQMPVHGSWTHLYCGCLSSLRLSLLLFPEALLAEAFLVAFLYSLPSADPLTLSPINSSSPGRNQPSLDIWLEASHLDLLGLPYKGKY